MHRMLPLLFIATPALAQPRPPLAPKRSVVETHHGVAVTDDYRWLENGADPEVRAFIEAHSKATAAALDALPQTEALHRRLVELDEKRSTSYGVFPVGGRWYAIRRQPGRSHNAILELPAFDKVDEGKVLFDPDAYDPKGLTSVDWWRPSWDGKRLALSLSQKGSEAGTLRILDVATGKFLPDEIPRVQYGTGGGSVAWSADSRSILYTRYPSPGERPREDQHFYQEIWRHELGKPVTADRVVLAAKDLPKIAENELISSPDGARHVVAVNNGDGGQRAFWSVDGAPKLIARFEDRVVDAHFAPDGALYLLSLDGAPQGKVLRLAPGETSLAKATLALPEGPGSITEIEVTKNRLFVGTMSGGPSEVRAYPLDGKGSWEKLPAPPVSTAYAIRPLDARNGDDVLVTVMSYVEPTATYRWSPGRAPERTSLIPRPDLDLSPYEVTRVMVKSKDGTQVPLNLVHKKGLKKNGQNPVILYGYGGYGISEKPSFTAFRLLWLERGGVFAFANIRGGAEFGERWHEEGMLEEKQNVFDDFIACAEWLVKSKVTSRKKLAIQGGSNGGLLMGAVMTQRPELFRAVHASVGVFDMVRTELSANGAYNVTEYGTVKDPKQFAALYAYSPYHRVKDGVAYPSILLTTGENDPRVDPMQSRKFAARLLAAGAKDVLLLSDAQAGHGMPSREQRLRATARTYAFFMDRLGMK